MNRIFTFLAIFTFSLLITGCTKELKDYKDPYDPQAAIEYSYKYAETRNPEYANFDSNCTNYISQILIAGGKKMDEAIAPKENVRVTYHDTTEQWFSTYIETKPERWKEFSISSSFCRTESFVEYWTEIRGMKLSTYVNSFDGLLKLYNQANEGDIILLYNEKGEVVHLCLLAVKKDKQLLVNANTKDYKDHNILDISASTYPQIGLLQMK